MLALQPYPRIGVAAQTTQPVVKVRHTVDLIKRRFPDSLVRLVTPSAGLRKIGRLPQPISRQSDVVVVIGAPTATTRGKPCRPAGGIVRTCTTCNSTPTFGPGGLLTFVRWALRLGHRRPMRLSKKSNGAFESLLTP